MIEVRDQLPTQELFALTTICSSY